VPEIAITTSFLFGGFVNSLLGTVAADDPEKAIDQVIEMMLRGLGVSLEESHEIAHRPLGPLEGN
jgi:hypothetical protein